MSDTISPTEKQARSIQECQQQARLICNSQNFEHSAGLDSFGALRLAAALRSAGYVIVPREPTEAMLDAGCDIADTPDADDVWRAMIAVALGEPS